MLNRFQLAMALGPVLSRMEARGVLIDQDHLIASEKTLLKLRETVNGNLVTDLGPINFNSSKQLLTALRGHGIYPTYKRKPSVDKRALAQLEPNEIVNRLIEFSQIETLLTSFIKPYRALGSTIHPFFSQIATRTGRLACYRPNLMQVPIRGSYAKLVKNAFIARPDTLFIEADYGQIEPRILSHFSQSRNLCEMFNSNIDFHTFTADRLNIPRDVAKVLNLSVGYLASEYSVSRTLQCGLEEAREHINKWWTLFPDLRMWIYAYIELVKSKGYVETLMGLRIPIAGLDEPNSFKRGEAERQVVNNLCQGSAQEIMQLSMIKLDAVSINLLLQIHDSVLIEHNKNDLRINDICVILKEVFKLRVPLTVSIKTGERWGEMSVYE